MCMILNIETSTQICSVSIAQDGKCVDVIVDVPEKNGEPAHGQHSKLLAVLIKEILEKNQIEPSDLKAIAVSEGPGSYTGLRIGVSTAKGLCLGLDAPLVSVNTLFLVAKMAVSKSTDKYDYIIPMIDAKRMEVYCSVYDSELKLIKETAAKIIDENSFVEYAGKRVLFCGNGAEKCKEILGGNGKFFNGDIYPSAEYMAEITNQYFQNGEIADLVYFEPFYLKSFIATTPKKLL